MKGQREAVFLGWGLGRDTDMVELHGPGGAGERGGRFRLIKFQPAAPKGGRARRVLDEAVEKAFAVDRLAEAACALPGVRKDVVDRVKAEIRAGAYETPEKIETLAERILEELGEDLGDE